MGSDAYRKALDAQVNSSVVFTGYFHSRKKMFEGRSEVCEIKAQWLL